MLEYGCRPRRGQLRFRTPEGWQNGYCTGLENRRPKGLLGSSPRPSAFPLHVPRLTRSRVPIFLLMVFAVGMVCGIAVSVLRRAGDVSSQFGATPRPLELERRLARLEQAAEDSARAMERLEEGQRFLLNALTARGDSAHPSPRALAPGEHPAAPASEAPASPTGERRG